MRGEGFRGLTLSELLTIKQVEKLFSEGRRIDERGFLEFREIEINTNVIEKAFGSARVSLGDTVVVAGVNFELGTPFPDSPDKGILIVEGEVLPTASFGAEAGPPNEYEIELSRVVDRGIRESEMLPLEEYVIKHGEVVYKIFLDFNIINDDGNLIDAANLAAVAALATAKMPDINYVKEHIDELNSINIKEVPKVGVKIRDLPIAVTLGLKNNKFIVDPTFAEEIAVESLITITHTNKGELCSIQLLKGGLTFEQVFEAINIAYEKNIELRSILERNGIKVI
ncbi:RNA-binding protein [Candidatus Geothermarchaeota archaeon]|nr:MAG: RNA-binding protein [Candidatus Geothermarchaeota archaeon]HEW93705.1 exosome complex protein Rrp42 [Thermoprotei archaeon]